MAEAIPPITTEQQVASPVPTVRKYYRGKLADVVSRGGIGMTIRLENPPKEHPLDKYKRIVNDLEHGDTSSALEDLQQERNGLKQQFTKDEQTAAKPEGDLDDDARYRQLTDTIVADRREYGILDPQQHSRARMLLQKEIEELKVQRNQTRRGAAKFFINKYPELLQKYDQMIASLEPPKTQQ